MQVINVIPLQSGIFKETLSYFSSKNVPVGSIVTVEVRKKQISALVVSIEDATKMKTQIRKSSYTMKKLDSVKSKSFFLSAFTQAAQETAQYFATTTGEILQALTPKAVLTEHIKIKEKHDESAEANKNGFGVTSEAFTFQAEDKERLTTYKSLIREEFAKGSSVFFCLPTILNIKTTLTALERGIKEYTFILHSGLSKKDLLATWTKIINETHPVLIIATGTFLSIPRRDISTIILDKENSRSYKTLKRPHFDIRTFVEIFAKKAKMKLIFGDIFLRPETIWRTNQNEFIEFNPLKFRSLSTAEQSIVDMREYKKSGGQKTFSILSNELKKRIKDSKDANENLFILTGRRGLSPVTVCNDCGELVQCDKCKTPMVLHKRRDGNIFLCHKCGHQEDAERRCSVCSGWRLAALGIGIEGVEEEIKKNFPDIKIFKIDSDCVKTYKKGMTIALNFFSSPGSILLGTEMALPYLYKDIDGAAVVGIDSLFTVPDFRMNEKIFNTLLSLRGKTLAHLLIQTRNPNEKIFKHLVSGNLLDFYRNEIKQRKEFGYPPFSTLIKITCQGRKPTVTKEMDKLSEILKDYKPSIYPAFTPGARGAYTVNALLVLERSTWIDEKLLGILRSLPPSFIVRVDPGDLL
jgi:primosomal protein N' (replication factor Y)